MVTDPDAWVAHEGVGDGSAAVSATDYSWFVDVALGGMASIVEQLGDRPGQPGDTVPRRELAT